MLNSYFSARWRYGQALSHQAVGRGRLLHCQTHNIQVSLGATWWPECCNIYIFHFRSRNRTLQELVEHYSKDSDGLCVNLCKPCVQVSDAATTVATAIVCFNLISYIIYNNNIQLAVKCVDVWDANVRISHYYAFVFSFLRYFEMPNTCIILKTVLLYIFHVFLIFYFD